MTYLKCRNQDRSARAAKKRRAQGWPAEGPRAMGSRPPGRGDPRRVERVSAGRPVPGLARPLRGCPSAGRTLDNNVDRSLDSGMASGRRPVYVISIAASLAGCHPRTLRIYEEEGLLDPVRTDTNIRLYSDDDLERVRAIRYLTQSRRVNLAGVKLLFQLRDAADLLGEIAAQLAEADAAAEGGGRVENVTDGERGRRPRNRQRPKGVEL